MEVKPLENASLRARVGAFGLIVMLVTTLFVGFYFNFWQAAPARFFESHQRSSQSQVIGRLAHAQRDGLFAHAGLLGRLMPPPAELSRAQWQYVLYERDLEAAEFEPYLSHPGGQGFVFSLIDHATNLSNTANVELFQAIAAFFTAGVLALLLHWIRSEFGWVALSVALITALASQWLTVFGRNLYWVTGVFFVPMLFLCFGLQRQRQPRYSWIVLNSTWSMLVKCLMTGFEFITTTTIMMTTPIVYYAVRDGWSLRQATSSIAAAGAGAVIAVILTLFVLLIQIAIVRGGIDAGIDHIAYSLEKRSHGDPGSFAKPKLQDSLEVHLADVVSKYLQGDAFTARGIADWLGLEVHVLGLKVRRIGISYLHLILLFAGCTAVLLSRRLPLSPAVDQPRAHERAAQALALCAATWWAALAPLSWFVIFKGHSYLHPHVNFIAWHMPFTFFGAALTGYCAVSAWESRLRVADL